MTMAGSTSNATNAGISVLAKDRYDRQSGRITLTCLPSSRLSLDDEQTMLIRLSKAAAREPFVTG